MQKQNLKSDSIWHASKWNETRKYISTLKFTRNLFIFDLKKKRKKSNPRTKKNFFSHLFFHIQKNSKSCIYIFVSSSNLQAKNLLEILETPCSISTGLFHKAIAQSGVAINPWAIITREPSKYAYELAAKLGEESTDPKTVLEFLRTVDAQKLAFTETQLLKSTVSPPEQKYEILESE